MIGKLKKHFVLESDSSKPLFVKILDNKIYRMAIGAIAGGIAGYFYWKFIGCNGGSCPITANPYQTVLLFGALGAVLAKDKNEKKAKEKIEK